MNEERNHQNYYYSLSKEYQANHMHATSTKIEYRCPEHREYGIDRQALNVAHDTHVYELYIGQYPGSLNPSTVRHRSPKGACPPKVRRW